MDDDITVYFLIASSFCIGLAIGILGTLLLLAVAP